MDTPSIAREMTRREILWAHFRGWLTRQRRRFLPYLIWYGDEVDIHITLAEDRLANREFSKIEDAFGSALKQFNQGAFFEIERRFGELGIEFDRGMGCHGRDWEWDWSLRGPISVQFLRAAKRPEQRSPR